MSNKLHIIGVGPGAKEFVHPATGKIIQESDVIIGGKRNLELFSELNKEQIIIGNNLEQICEYITLNAERKKIAVLATGDPGLYSIMQFLNSRLKNIEIEVLPGISSLQYLCCKLKMNWDDIHITSLHGREWNDLPSIINNSKKLAIFAGGEFTPNKVCKRLADGEIGNVIITVGENLSYPDERVIRGTPEELADMHFGSLSIMIVERTGDDACPAQEDANSRWSYTTPGIPDDMFIRGDVPMTKEEVRAVTISKLRLTGNDIVYDIGAGTGSVSVECALQCRNGKVYAIDKSEEAVELVVKNAGKFNLNNILTVKGEAPGVMQGLPQPDRVFIGGTSGSMDEILEWINNISKKVRVVINTVTIESTFRALESLENKNFKDIEIVSVSVSRGRNAGKSHLMQALNPVYIISGEKGEG